jgi:hypothetical protein
MFAGRRRLSFVILLLLVVINGCTAASFSELQSDFIVLYQQKDRCEKYREENKPLPVECLADHNQALLEIARETEKIADKTGDERTQIGLYRLGAIAAWQASEKGWTIATDLSSKGERLCETLDPKSFGAPRDCAILMIMPALIAHDSFVAEMEGIVSKDATQKVSFFQRFSRSYKVNTWDALVRYEEKLKGDPRLDKTILKYISLQKQFFWCTLGIALDEITKLRRQLGDSKALEVEYNRISRDRDVINDALGQAPDCSELKNK